MNFGDLLKLWKPPWNSFMVSRQRYDIPFALLAEGGEGGWARARRPWRTLLPTLD
jgi:hypothetical protein